MIESLLAVLLAIVALVWSEKERTQAKDAYTAALEYQRRRREQDARARELRRGIHEL